MRGEYNIPFTQFTLNIEYLLNKYFKMAIRVGFTNPNFLINSTWVDGVGRVMDGRTNRRMGKGIYWRQYESLYRGLAVIIGIARLWIFPNQTSEYSFSRPLIGYLSAGYPVLVYTKPVTY